MRFFCAEMSYYVLFSNHEATHLYRVSQYNRILNLRIYLSLTCVFALAIGAKCKQCASAIVIRTVRAMVELPIGPRLKRFVWSPKRDACQVLNIRHR